jgi:hypothetical protein
MASSGHPPVRVYPPRVDWVTKLFELRVREARAKGLLDDLPGKGEPLPEDPLASLPAEARAHARVLAAVGAVPDEVRLLREIVRLSAAVENAPGAERAALSRELRDRRIELRLLLERTGRARLAREL